MFHKSIIIVFVLSFCIKSLLAHEFVATLTDIQDGDTLSALVHDEDTKIRLLDVDCFEIRKSSRAKFQHIYYGVSYEEMAKRGKQSKNKLEELLKNQKNVLIKWDRRDGFGRILGKVYVNETDINKYMIEKGGCNQYVPKDVLFSK